jgi:hypothetical protein
MRERDLRFANSAGDDFAADFRDRRCGLKRMGMLFRVLAEALNSAAARDFSCATRAGGNPEVEAMQFDDRGDHTQAQAEAFDASTFV